MRVTVLPPWLLPAALLGLLMTGCGQPAEPTGTDAPVASAAPGADEVPFRNVQDGVAFVGDAACAACHEAEYQGYQAHGMAQSFYPLTPENRAEPAEGVVVTDAASGFHYRIVEVDGTLYQEEFRVDAAGEEYHRLRRAMTYVMGSGSAARTYLAEEQGRLYQLPLTWYTQEGRWDFSPGYAGANKRFDRLVPDRCMTCHNAYPEPVPFAEGKYGALPHGISCERCHGPGGLHVEERLSDPEGTSEVDYTIVNPAHLTLDRRLDVCQQCHLHTDVSFLKPGRTAYDFRPGQALADYVTLYASEAPGTAERIGVISHADRMQQSACFIETAARGGAMDCTTCHDPHQGFRALGPEFFNATCRDCHSADALAVLEPPSARAVHAAADANCIDCHMPKVAVEEAPHASFTDHKIRVVRDGEPAPVAAHASVDLVPYFAADRERATADVDAGIAYVAYGRQQGDPSAFREGIRRLAEALGRHPDHDEGQYVLGFAQLQLGEAAAAIPHLEAAVTANPDHPERLNALAQAYEATGTDPLKTARLYRRALEIQPALADVRVNYGRFLEAQGALDEAADQYRLAVQEQPALAAGHFNLGTAYLRLGDAAQAEASLLEAIRLDPRDAEARGNLGMLYASQERLPDARAQFERAVEANPAHPVALGNLAAFHMNAGDLAAAIRLLERAVEADPRYVDGLINLSIALLNTNRPAEARRYAEQAVRVDPQNARARQILSAL